MQGMHSVGPDERLMIEVYDEKRRFSSITSTAVAPFMKQDKRLDKLKFSLYTRTSFLFIITRFGSQTQQCLLRPTVRGSSVLLEDLVRSTFELVCQFLLSHGASGTSVAVFQA